MDAESLEEISKEIQGIFRKTPVLLVGSGFSCGYGLPGMGALAEYLIKTVGGKLEKEDAKRLWEQQIDAIRDNLEAGLGNIPSGAAGCDEIAAAVRKETAELILEKTVCAERQLLQEKRGSEQAPARLLKRLFDGAPQNAEGIHVITTNYDTLLELFCDLAELPLDTGFTGFRRRKPRQHEIFPSYYSRVLVPEKRQQKTEHRICKTVRLYKPHGSISWVDTEDGPMEVLNDTVSNNRGIVVPGPWKYHDVMVRSLFDGMRKAMNEAIARAEALLCIGFGFNDDHLQGAIKARLSAKMPAIIITKAPTPSIEQLLCEHPHVIAVFEDGDGAVCRWNGNTLQIPGALWQLDDFLKKFVE